MFEQPSSGAITSSQNAPQFGYTSTVVLGNQDFSIVAPQPIGQVQTGFPQLQYISVYDELWFQSVSNPNTNPALTTSGSNTGEQVVTGQTVQTDATGTARVSEGTQITTS